MPIAAAYMVPHPPMIVPEVGHGSEKQIEKTIAAYRAVAAEIAEIRPETIIVTSPHTVLYADYFHISPGEHASGDFGSFRAPGVKFRKEYDTELVSAVCALAKGKDFPAGTLGERDRHLDHGTMVPLYFVDQAYMDYRLVRIGLSGLPLPDHYALGQMIRKAVEQTGRRVVLIASGDLSHKLQDYGPYGFAKEGPEYDARIMDAAGRAAFGEMLEFDESFCDKAAECGHRSFVIMAGALDGLDVEAKVYSHEDVTGVGYGICSFHPGGENPERRFLLKYRETQAERLRKRRAAEDPYVRLARETVESWVLERKTPDVPEWAAEEMKRDRAGVFVSIHEDGRLRGCIGTFLPTRENIAREIISNAVSASTRDPRFDAVRPDELDKLEINVDVLSAPEKISGPEELDVKRYGVIVSSGSKRGLLLPDLDGVDTVEEQIDIARRKGGIRDGERIALERFEVVRHV
ncbi:AmmeMemoRadiSam system protein A [Clostridiales bacterium]|nr:AmmeMemoRadiSam system protein A [Clostridiales bacterium]